MEAIVKNFLLGYTPADEHFTSKAEMDFITRALDLEHAESLRELRNEVVMLYHDEMESEIKFDNNGGFAGRTERYWKLSNAMMSVTAVIDHFAYSR